MQAPMKNREEQAPDAQIKEEVASQEDQQEKINKDKEA